MRAEKMSPPSLKLRRMKKRDAEMSYESSFAEATEDEKGMEVMSCE